MTWLNRRDSLNDLRGFQEDFNRIFNSTLPRFMQGEESLGGKWVPSVDILENDNSIVLEADLPGVKPEDFKLHIENFKLTLSGERRFENEKKEDNYHRVERSYGTFTRVFALPSTVSVDEVKADLRDGVLKVTLPKREEVKARQIEVTIRTEAGSNKAKSAEVK
ncbi:MAG: Hsp20/alpha crystallin family protein [Acidobacteria bacterium]|nr:Hsp20/alpha crystallin family protein [Acidobacteriota bacterium]